MDSAGAVRDRQSGGVEADTPGSAAEDEHGGVVTLGERGHDSSPGVGEIVAGGDTQGRDRIGDADQHVIGVGHPKLVGDHAAPGTTGRAEAERGERAVLGGDGAF